jgi:hypothetical protein
VGAGQAVPPDHDLITGRGKIHKRKKGASRQFRGAYGHTPLSDAEDIPWRCRRLVIAPALIAHCRLAKATKDISAMLHLAC